jgi:hypothetical protein
MKFPGEMKNDDFVSVSDGEVTLNLSSTHGSDLLIYSGPKILWVFIRSDDTANECGGITWPKHVETVNLSKVKSEVCIKLVLVVTKLRHDDTRPTKH